MWWEVSAVSGRYRNSGLPYGIRGTGLDHWRVPHDRLVCRRGGVTGFRICHQDNPGQPKSQELSVHNIVIGVHEIVT